jgi:uncharacterized protein (TIGR03000 family)
MYSVVLMAALTAGTNTPAWGCHGCWGGRLGCHGCWGGGLSGWCGCHGSGGLCYGCYGGYGCYGWYNGCYGCYGGACYGGYGSGCYGSGWYFAASCYGTGCYGCAGPVYAPATVAPPAGAPGAAPPGGRAPEPVPAPKKEESKTTALDQARLIVTLPANAKLYVDDQLTKATSERRVFNSPRLEPGQTYYYILRAEMTGAGKTQSETKRVLLHAGDVIETSFLDLEKLVPVGTEASARR